MGRRRGVGLGSAAEEALGGATGWLVAATAGEGAALGGGAGSAATSRALGVELGTSAAEPDAEMTTGLADANVFAAITPANSVAATPMPPSTSQVLFGFSTAVLPQAAWVAADAT